MKLLFELLMVGIITANVTAATLTENPMNKLELFGLAGISTVVMVAKDNKSKSPAF